MSKLGINTGTFADDGTGDSLLQGGIKINSNFNEIYNSIGDGSNINIGVGKSIISTILSSGNVGIGSTIPTSKIDILGDAKISGIVTATTFNGQINSGLGTVTSISGTDLSYSGVGTVGSLKIGSTQVISGARQLQNITSLDSTTTTTIESAIANSPNTFTDIQVTGISTFTNGPILVGTATSTGTTSQPLQVTGDAYISGRLGIGTTNSVTELANTGIHISEGQILVTRSSGLNIGIFSGTTTEDLIRITQLGTGNALVVEDSTNPDATPFVVGAAGSVGIGTSNPTSLLHLGPGGSTGSSSPLKFSAGTNLSSIESGVIEYDGTTLFATPNTNYGRATIPTVSYNSGAGTAGITASTDYAIFPAASDTITLPIGTYLARLRVRIAVSGSTVSSACSFSMRGSGNAVGSFSWGGTAAILDAGAASSFIIAATALGTPFTVTGASAANPRQYIFTGEGILKVTTQGTIIPSYSFSSTLTSGTTTLVADNYIILESLDTQSTAAFGPSGVGWG